MKQELKEEIARNAASTWCRCFKCDGKVNATGCVCDMDKTLTCNKWYHGYRTALLALGDDRITIKGEITMATKEKAKAYDESRERMKDFLNEWEDCGALGEVMEKAKVVFPELKEWFEDEKIRKYLITYFSDIDDCASNIKGKDVVAWLEKQGEQNPKMKPKWLYRLEYKDNSCGLWYNGDGKWCFESGIGSLDDSCKTKSLPMDYDERYKQDGRDWFSSCTNKEDLLHWYSKEDAKILMNKGFVFTRYLATEYHEYEQQTVFIKETSLYREEIDFFSLFENQNPKWSEEDEHMLFYIEEAVKGYYSELGLQPTVLDWLKSLKDKCVP